MPEGKQGWADVQAGPTAVSMIDEAAGGLRYRGYALNELTERASFEEVAYLLLHERLPSASELNSFRALLRAQRTLPAPLRRMLEQMPHGAHPVEVLRLGVDALGCLEPEGPDRPPLAIASRLLASLPSMLLYWHAFTTTLLRIDTTGEEDTLAGHLLHMMHDRQPDAQQRHALDTALMLYAEQEFSVSTFAARTIASTQADFYSAVAGALAASRGLLHGGAGEAALQMVESYRTPEAAEAGVMAALGRKETIMGFGHRVFKGGDPRSALLKIWARRQADQSEEGRRRLAVAERIEAVMMENKRLQPNLDFYAALVFRGCGLPPTFFTPLFAFANLAGWVAHIMEQRADNRLIRPTSVYVGPAARPVPLLEQR